jgi:beta-phosphoglucomutase
MIVKACLFDLDGVIVDTARFHYLAWKELAEQLGIDFTEKDNERLKGISRMDSLNILLEIGHIKLSEEQKMIYADRKNRRYLEYIEKLTPDDILPGVRNFLKGLRDAHIATGLGSASRNATTILNRLDLAEAFDVVVDGNMITHAKPHPEIFVRGAQLLKTKPANCMVFEDAAAGIEAAHKGGMKCIGIGIAEILSEADLVIPGFSHFTCDDFLDQVTLLSQ